MSAKNQRMAKETRKKPHADIELIKYLSTNKLKYTSEMKFDDLRFRAQLRCDYFINHPKLKKMVIIESDGMQHFYQQYYLHDTIPTISTIIRYHRDILKNYYCIRKAIHLLRFAYTEVSRLPQILNEFWIQCLESEKQNRVCMKMIPEQMYNDQKNFMNTPNYTDFKKRIENEGFDWLRNVEDKGNLLRKAILRKYILQPNGVYTLVPAGSSLSVVDAEDDSDDEDNNDVDEHQNNNDVKNNKRKRDEEPYNEDGLPPTSCPSSSSQLLTALSSTPVLPSSSLQSLSPLSSSSLSPSSLSFSRTVASSLPSSPSSTPSFASSLPSSSSSQSSSALFNISCTVPTNTSFTISISITTSEPLSAQKHNVR